MCFVVVLASDSLVLFRHGSVLLTQNLRIDLLHHYNLRGENFCLAPRTAVFDTSLGDTTGTLASGVSRIKTHTKIKYQYLTYSTSFDTLTAEPFCPTSPIAAVLRRKGYT